MKRLCRIRNPRLLNTGLYNTSGTTPEYSGYFQSPCQRICWQGLLFCGEDLTLVLYRHFASSFSHFWSTHCWASSIIHSPPGAKQWRKRPCGRMKSATGSFFFGS